jgi:sigma-E factor negative regulatory protein RseA
MTTNTQTSMTHLPSPDAREQLSAMMDGELQRDAMRFVLKRCESDSELGECWQRWHLAGEVMRGGKPMPLRIDLVRAVSLAIEDEARTAAGVGRTVLRWGGGFAVAASVALAALLVVQPSAAPEPALAASVPSAAPVSRPMAMVAPSALREQDLRPPYRLDAQTVADDGMPYRSMRFDPRIENYLRLQGQHALAPQHAVPYVLQWSSAEPARARVSPERELESVE